MERVNAVILAGGTLRLGPGDAARELDKAFVEVAGRTLIALTVSALREAERVDEVIAIGPHELLGHPVSLEVDAVHARRSTEGAENVELALAVAGQWPRALLTGCDLPLLSPTAVDDFVARAPANAHIAYPMVRLEAARSRFPGYSWRAVHLADGDFVGGAMLIVDLAEVRRHPDLVRRAFGERKSQLALARTLGLGTVVQLMLRRATVASLTARIGAATGLQVAAVESPHPEIALDVDREEHLAMVTEILAAEPASD